MAEEALALHIEAIEQDGEAIPEPSSLESAMADAWNRSAVLVLVRSPAPKTVRINITLPEDVLSAIDRYASHGFSRSRFIAKAAKDAMKFEEA
jgi:HicB-like antitoxin of HicAB toxin-antitoxin system